MCSRPGEIVLKGAARELLDNPEIQEAYLGKGRAKLRGPALLQSVAVS
jgi:hypothetical protein